MTEPHSPNAPGTSRLILGLWLLTAAVFLPAVRCGYVNWDDGKYVAQNPVVLGGLSWANCRHALTDVIFSNWAPLTILSYQLDATLFGKAAWGFHLTNVLLHATTVAILAVALTRMTGAPGRSIAVAALFGLHPLRVESVVWIAERKDVLSVFFFVLTMLFYERYCRSPTPRRFVPVAIGMLASLLAKSTLVTLPVLLLLVDIWPLGRIGRVGPRPEASDPPRAGRYPLVSWRAAIVEKLPLIGLAVVFSAVTIIAQGGAIQSAQSLPLATSRLPNALHAFAWYLATTIWPTGLKPFYRHAASELSAVSIAGCGLVAVAWGVMITISARRRPSLAVGLAWFGVALLPMLGIVAQPGFQGHADRFTYVPHIGLFLTAVWLVADVADRWRVPHTWQAGGVVATVAVLAAATLWQIPIWRSPDTLWPAMIRRDPACSMAQMKYANHLVATRRLAVAEAHYLAAIEHATNDWPGHVCRITSLSNLACLYHDLGQADRARTARDLAVAIDPNDVAVEQMLEHLRGLGRLGSREGPAGAP